MKALIEQVTIDEARSMLVRQYRLRYFDAPWHFHPEYELTYIISGSGHRFVGDHVAPFQAGDLVLLGPDLPHFWRCDNEFYQSDGHREAESLVVQFPAAFVPNVLAGMPEAQSVCTLLDRARYGIRFGADAVKQVADALGQLAAQTGLNQVLTLLHIMDGLANDAEARLLASGGYQLAPSVAETERMKRVLEFTLAHFRNEIRIGQIASEAGMAPAAFCRYFKKRTNRSYIDYVNELRISHARKLLISSDLTVGQVGLECGFNNVSHFHRQFRLQLGITPLQYQIRARQK